MYLYVEFVFPSDRYNLNSDYNYYENIIFTRDFALAF